MITKFKLFELSDFSLNKDYQKMVNLVFDAEQSVFYADTNGKIIMKFWFNNLDKNRIEFICNRFKNFDYEIFGTAIIIKYISQSYLDDLEEEYNLLKDSNKYNV